MPQDRAEDRHIEKGALDDRLLFLEQGNEEDRIEIRQVVADNDGRADGPDLIPDIQGDSGGDEAQQAEKPPEENAIQPLEGGLPIRTPERGRHVAGGKKKEESQYEIDPQQERHDDIQQRFEMFHREGHGRFQTNLLISRFVLTPPKAKFWMDAIRIGCSRRCRVCRIMAHRSSGSSRLSVGAINPSCII